MSDEVVVEISEEPSLARLVKELPPEQQAEFKKELVLYDIRARDEDRHRVPTVFRMKQVGTTRRFTRCLSQLRHFRWAAAR